MDEGMTADRWQKIKRVFAAAQALVGDEREAFLQEACAGDEALRNEVRALLDAHDAPGPVDELQDKVMASFYAQVAPRTLEGRRIGSYEIIRELGRGGMGRVYLAHRADGQYEQRVALKLLRGDMASADRTERFLAERQILAALAHPNIARLLDGGVTEDGQPYFVMEYVEGRPLDEYCDEQQLSIRERLRLFLSVCDAVQYAHRALVVHRDLKPSNMLVTSEGAVKLLDFGIAKLLEPDHLLQHAPPHTRTGLLPMTPAYASPEQVRGDAITTASDVYQLGVVLYELLSGRRPYEVSGCTPSEVERVICEHDPARPSTVVTRVAGDDEEQNPQVISDVRQTRPEQLQKKLRGDLDTIVLKALRKEPDRRYESAEQLAEDLRRHLGGRPVAAHPDSLRYRARKFARRHRWGVAITAVILVLLVGYAGTITWHSQQTQAALTQAEHEAQKAEQVTEFVMGLFEASDPMGGRGDTLTARTLLERGVEQADQLGEQPSLQAQMLEVVGQVYGRLGRYDEARPLLERALDIHRELHGDTHNSATQSMVHLATVLHKAGDYEAAEPLLRDALSAQEGNLGPDHPEVAFTRSMMGGVLMALGDLDEAEAMLREALAVQRSTYGDEHPDVSETLNILGLLLDERDELTEAEAVMREALQIRQSLLGDRDPRVAMSLNNLAMLLRKKGDYEAAEPVYREALAVKRALYGDEHPSIATSLNGLGLLLRDRGDDEAAEPYLRQALEMNRALRGPMHPQLAASLNNFGNFLEDQGRLDEAIAHLEESRSMLQMTLGEAHPLVAYPTIGLARILMKQNQPHEAEPLVREAHAIREGALPPGHSEIIAAVNMLGRCLIQLERYAEAEETLLAAYAELDDRRDEAQEHWRETTSQLADLYEAWGRPDSAKQYQALLADAR